MRLLVDGALEGAHFLDQRSRPRRWRGMRGCGAGAAGGYGGAAGEGEECKHVREEAVVVEARHFVDLLWLSVVALQGAWPSSGSAC